MVLSLLLGVGICVVAILTALVVYLAVVVVVGTLTAPSIFVDHRPSQP